MQVEKDMDLVISDKKELEAIRKKLEKEQRDIRIKAFTKNKLSIIGLVIILLLIVLAIIAPLITRFDPYEVNVVDRLLTPSGTHWFGTDELGRDVYTRVIYGIRISLIVGFSVSAISGILGMIIGLYACYNSIFDNILMRICDGLRAIPSTLLAICLMAVMGADIKNVIIALSIVNTPAIARIARAAALTSREQTYIEAMHCLGASATRILWRHIAPNTLTPVIVQMTFVFATAIISEAALSFLGAGVPIPLPSWGSILNEGKMYIFTAWWLIVFPGIFTSVSVLGLNLFGDGLRDLLDPLTK